MAKLPLTYNEDMAKNNWKDELSAEQYRILRGGETEPPWSGALLHNDRDGTYTCAACGQDLFDSEAKFDSGSGWPSFSRPKNLQSLDLLEDNSNDTVRTEVRCRSCGSHLGHVFDDGPRPTGKRYCINSLSLGFKPSAE